MAAQDHQSFVRTIASRYGRRLRRFLAVRLGNAADVPDLAQEVFLRLLRVAEHGAIRNPEAYLFTIASHVVHQYTVRRSTEPLSVDIADVFAEPQATSRDDPTARAENAQRIEQLERLLVQLPPRIATTLVLHRLEGYSLQEIADRLGVSRETAKKYLARAVEHCRDHYMEAE